MSGSEASDDQVAVENNHRGGRGGGGNRRRDAGDDEEDNGGRGGRGGGFKGEELASKALTIQSKRFYLDVKHNDRGRFIKFAEVAGGGRKSRVFMSMRTANAFKELLQEVIIEKSEEAPSNKQNKPAPAKDSPSGGGRGGRSGGGRDEGSGSGMIHSETLLADKRRYFFDLRENNRGRFLRITQTSIGDGTRFSIALPAEGLKQLAEALADLIDEFGEGYMDEPPQVELPESRNMRAENKYFYFDPGHNDRGDYLKISEVKPAMGARQTITVSLRSLPHFVEILSELMSKIQDMRAGDAGAQPVEAAGGGEK